MSSPSTTILDLPVDILLLIFPFLDVRSFLSLTSTCQALHKPDFTHDAAFWSALVRRDFRVPNQPVVQNDGTRWQKLYRRLRTQSRVFTWGNNERACLGHSFDPTVGLGSVAPARLRRHTRRHRHISWPGEMAGLGGLGVISDMQCGGWSTTLLTARGELYIVGVMDGLELNRDRPPFVQQPCIAPKTLLFPPGLPHPGVRYDPATAVQQFSAGRAHVLALSDSGRIWSWQNIDHIGLHVRFLNHDTWEDGEQGRRSNVRKVVAGWDKSAALVDGVGIVVWDVLKLEEGDTGLSDAALVLQSAVVPKTGFVRSKTRQPISTHSNDAEDLSETVGEVLNFIVLEQAILFNTSLGKVFAAHLNWNDDNPSIEAPIELPISRSEDRNASFATDVQGSFRSFAVFTKTGAVLTSDQGSIMRLMTAPGTVDVHPRAIFRRIPALQNKNVISIAFGDYHFHALHSPGYITSYGNEPQACGALGLGGHGDPEGRLRGIRYQGIGGDGRLVPHAYTEGRRVWFEEEKQNWIRYLTSGGTDPEEAAERVRLAIGSPGITAQGEVSEWIEQEGRDWERKYGLQTEDDDGLGAYFALSVSAAGWHSGALVLVNEELAKGVKNAVELLDDPSPDLSNNATEEAKAEASSSDSANVAAPPSKQPQQQPPPTSPNPPTSMLDRVADYGRYFLGLPPYNVSSAATHDPNAVTGGLHYPPNTVVPSPSLHPEPRNYGASPRDGVTYIWARREHFPRLRLSDGTDMPGQIDFDSWRYGRPEWRLNWEEEDNGEDGGEAN